MAYPINPTNGQIFNNKKFDSARNAWIESKSTDSDIGKIFSYAGSTEPSDHLFCQGQAVSRTTYSTLFSIIGTTFGVGDGSTTFNLPDLREANLVGVGTFNAVNGSTHGTITTHDVYTLGQFKDDQMQNIHGTLNAECQASVGASGAFTYAAIAWNGNSGDNNEINTYTFDTWRAARTGYNASGTLTGSDVTHGKNVGVNYIIRYQ